MAGDQSPTERDARSAEGNARIAWVDFAKGICIFLVVILHVNHYVQDWRYYATGWLDYFVEFAKPFRMPDFFLLSGLFMSRVIDRPWRRYLDTKVIHYYYFYVIWLPIIFLAFEVLPSAWNGWDNAGQLPMKFFRELVDPSYPLWFIHSLPIYFVIARLLKKVPWWAVWGCVAILQSSNIHTGSTVVDQFCLRFVYFYSGYAFSTQVFQISDYASSNPRIAGTYLLVWAVLEAVMVASGVAHYPGVSLVLGYLGALAVICAACLLCTSPHMSWLKFLGQNSIVVYLTFMIPMAILERVFRWKIEDVGSAALLVAIGSVGLSVLAYLMVRNTPLRFLYIRPSSIGLKTLKSPMRS